jgi:hypothetical protein
MEAGTAHVSTLRGSALRAEHLRVTAVFVVHYCAADELDDDMLHRSLWHCIAG